MTTMRSSVIPTAVLAVVAMFAQPARAAVPIGNLVQNPGAEAAPGAADDTTVAPPPSWGTISNLTAVQYGTTGFPTSAPGGETNFFAGGPANATSVAEQVINLTAAVPEIDAGRVSVQLSGVLGGVGAQEDAARVTAAFEDATSDINFSTLQIGPVTAADRNSETTLVPRSASATVPAGTRHIRLTITATRAGGAYNDGYADNISVVLTESSDPGPGPPGPPPPPPPGPGDTTPPETTITVEPANGQVGDTAPAYEFTSSEPGSRFECRAYDPTSPPQFTAARMYNACTSPYLIAGAIPKGEARLFEVRAIDAAGNVDPTPEMRRVVNRGDKGPPAKPSKCRMVAVDRAHGGKRMLPGCRLALIKRGKVPCMQAETGKVATCRFKRRTGPFLESKKGPDYALVGDSLSRDGDKVGNWVVAAKRSAARTVPCRAPARRPGVSAADTAGRVAEGTDLAQSCVVEEQGSEWNALFAYGWYPLLNYATGQVCSSNDPDRNPHPDYADYVGSPRPGVFCYSGRGAGLNDINGMERDETTAYFTGAGYCHYIVSGGYEVPAAKRPATKSLPAPGVVNTKTPIVWRPVNPNVDIANP